MESAWSSGYYWWRVEPSSIPASTWMQRRRHRAAPPAHPHRTRTMHARARRPVDHPRRSRRCLVGMRETQVCTPSRGIISMAERSRGPFSRAGLALQVCTPSRGIISMAERSRGPFSRAGLALQVRCGRKVTAHTRVHLHWGRRARWDDAVFDGQLLGYDSLSVHRLVASSTFTTTARAPNGKASARRATRAAREPCLVSALERGRGLL